MNALELAKPDNGADRTIRLAISGNRLVSVLNALDQSLFQAGIYRFQDNDVTSDHEWYRQLHAVTEAMRDELSRQRNESLPVRVISTWHSVAAEVLYGHGEGWPSLSTFHVYREDLT